MRAVLAARAARRAALKPYRKFAQTRQARCILGNWAWELRMHDSRQRANSFRTHWSVAAAHHGVGVLLGRQVFVGDA